MRRRAHLALALPIAKVFNIALATRIHCFASAYEHIAGWNDVGERRLTRVTRGHPYRDGDVVGGLTIGDGDEAVHAYEQLGSPVVECCESVGSVRRGRHAGLECAL